MLTTAYCSVGGDECVSEHGRHLCENAAGHCVVKRDGYYIMTAACVTLSAVLLMTFILPTIKRLQCEYRYPFGNRAAPGPCQLTASITYLGLAGQAVRQGREDMTITMHYHGSFCHLREVRLARLWGNTTPANCYPVLSPGEVRPAARPSDRGGIGSHS